MHKVKNILCHVFQTVSFMMNKMMCFFIFHIHKARLTYTGLIFQLCKILLFG